MGRSEREFYGICIVFKRDSLVVFEREKNGRDPGASAVDYDECYKKEPLAPLLFVTVEAVEGSEGAEEAVLFVVDSGGEEQGVGRSGGRVVPEGERPQAVDGHERAIGILHEADEFVGEAVERGDPSAAEIGDENGIADLAEIASGTTHAPRRVEPVAVLEVADVFARWSKDFDKAKAIATDGIVPWRILLGVGDEEAAADVLDVERREAARDALGTVFVIAVGLERILIEANALEMGVGDFDPGRAEIGDIEGALPVDLSGSCAFVDRAVGSSSIGTVDLSSSMVEVDTRVAAVLQGGARKAKIQELRRTSSTSF